MLIKNLVLFEFGPTNSLLQCCKIHEKVLLLNEMPLKKASNHEKNHGLCSLENLYDQAMESCCENNTLIRRPGTGRIFSFPSQPLQPINLLMGC